jgi:LuxR family maltose regulon positive regulatory protein
VLAAGKLDDYIMSPLVHAAAARTALHRGEVAGAREHLAQAARLRPLLTYAIPWGAVQAMLELGRSYLALDDVAGARAVLVQARDVLLGSRLEVARGALPGPSSLSTAELRLLPLLSTHLSFREIGERLYISPHTVKTQALSVYRKLGASSRSQAVQRLQEIGLVGA